MKDFTSIYRRWFHEVSRWARALGGPEADLDDLAQEVFLVVRRKLDDFDGRNPAAWLYRITARTVSDHRRRAWFRRLWHPGRDPLPKAHAAAPDELLEREETRRLLTRLLAELSPRHRESFMLFEVEGYTSAEIAALLGIPEATVRTRLHHARKRFLALVAEEKP